MDSKENMSSYLERPWRTVLRDFFWGSYNKRVAIIAGAVLVFVLGTAFGTGVYARAHDPLWHSRHVLAEDGPKLGPDGVPACDLLSAAQAKALTDESLEVTQAPGIDYVNYSYRRCDFTVGAFGNGSKTPKIELTTQVEPDGTAPAYNKTITSKKATPNQAVMSASASDLKQLKGATKAEYIYNGDTNDVGLLVTTPSRLTFTVWTTLPDQDLLISIANQALFNLN